MEQKVKRSDFQQVRLMTERQPQLLKFKQEYLKKAFKSEGLEIPTEDTLLNHTKKMKKNDSRFINGSSYTEPQRSQFSESSRDLEKATQRESQFINTKTDPENDERSYSNLRVFKDEKGRQQQQEQESSHQNYESKTFTKIILKNDTPRQITNISIGSNVDRIFNGLTDLYDKNEINIALKKARDAKKRQEVIDKILTRREEIYNADQIMKLYKCAPLINRFMNKVLKREVVQQKQPSQTGLIATQQGEITQKNDISSQSQKMWINGSGTDKNIFKKGFALSLFLNSKSPTSHAQQEDESNQVSRRETKTLSLLTKDKFLEQTNLSYKNENNIFHQTSNKMQDQQISIDQASPLNQMPSNSNTKRNSTLHCDFLQISHTPKSNVPLAKINSLSPQAKSNFKNSSKFFSCTDQSRQTLKIIQHDIASFLQKEEQHQQQISQDESSASQNLLSKAIKTNPGLNYSENKDMFFLSNSSSIKTIENAVQQILVDSPKKNNLKANKQQSFLFQSTSHSNRNNNNSSQSEFLKDNKIKQQHQLHRFKQPNLQQSSYLPLDRERSSTQSSFFNPSLSERFLLETQPNQLFYERTSQYTSLSGKLNQYFTQPAKVVSKHKKASSTIPTKSIERSYQIGDVSGSKQLQQLKQSASTIQLTNSSRKQWKKNTLASLVDQDIVIKQNSQRSPNNLDSSYLLHNSQEFDSPNSFASFTEIKLDHLYKQTNNLKNKLKVLDQQSSLVQQTDMQEKLLDSQRSKNLLDLSSAKQEIHAVFVRKLKASKKNNNSLPQSIFT